MGEMIENIAHQWRQPLSVISTASSGIKFKKEMDMLEDDDIEITMNNITSSVQHLSQTINDFRDFFKADKKKINFLISDTFKKTFTLISSQFRSANISVVNNITDTSLYGNEHELIQVLINILNNARDELVKKEQKVKLIIIDSEITNNIFTIKIKDNAGGVPDEIIKEVFNSHFTTKQESNGTGVGLYMSKMIIEEHMKGIIKVENIDFTHEDIYYQGAEFIISLPLHTTE